jgi:iron(III) transport system ATP-binding protein
MLEIRNLHATYVGHEGQKVHAVQGISLDVPAGKLFTLLGPSGCGKTTTMRCIAGLERPDSGEVLVNGKPVYSSIDGTFVPPNQRRFGMVFQSYAIWPHMNVYDNAAFPLRVRKKKLSRSEVEEKVMRVLHVVGLDALAMRDATNLSGGQQQRLALARALVMEPELLLLDEPLSNLDAKLRERMRMELKRLQRETGLTTIYVTHDQVEALALSHEIAVIREGRIVQRGRPRDIYDKPANEFVADFIGSTNLLIGTVNSRCISEGQYEVATEVGVLEVSSPIELQRGEQVMVSVRPEQVQPTSNVLAGPNVLTGKVEARAFLGECLDFHIHVGERLVMARVHPSTVGMEVGETVYIQLKPQQCMAIPLG